MGVGTFLPIISLPLVGSINYIAGGRGDGTIILILSAAVVAAVFYRYRRTAACFGFVALIIMSATLVRLLDAYATLRSATAGLAKDSPFGGLATLASNSVGVGLGWIPLIGGALTVLAAGLMSDTGSDKIESNPVGFSRPDHNTVAPPSTQEPDDAWTAKIDQKIAHLQDTRQRSTAIPRSRAFGKRIAH
jgi:hypothetical protein